MLRSDDQLDWLSPLPIDSLSVFSSILALAPAVPLLGFALWFYLRRRGFVILLLSLLLSFLWAVRFVLPGLRC